jgi:hypothetical protein
MIMKIRPIVHAVVLALLALPGAWAADLEDTLNARWRGGWVIVRPAIASNCDGYYNDAEVVGNQVNTKARRRFEAGELARVEREGLLDSRQEGPFTLFDALTCQVQLQIPRTGGNDAESADARLAEILELHGTAREAEASDHWNGRRRAPYPENYDQTLAEYTAWKAAQTNAAVQARIDEAIDEAILVKERIRSDPEYVEGLAAGIEEIRNRAFGSCEDLLSTNFSPDSPGGGRGSNWKQGYEDGQRLAYNLELIRQLRECFVEVP